MLSQEGDLRGMERRKEMSENVKINMSGKEGERRSEKNLIFWNIL